MQDRPTAIELLEAAADFIDREIVAATKGRAQFQSRVAANVMRIVAREIQMEDGFVRNEVRALAQLLGHPEPQIQGLDELHKAALALSEELCGKIRAGEADAGGWRAQVLAAVRRSVEDKLRIANPRYIEADLAARNAAG
ncbi:MAG TPA: DUF6285 domain-containing protein [Candidatus Binataceae bacterium]|nr:DUF6285 domain-containing protein [Candidatus Binataceae bacterium]